MRSDNPKLNKKHEEPGIFSKIGSAVAGLFSFGGDQRWASDKILMEPVGWAYGSPIIAGSCGANGEAIGGAAPVAPYGFVSVAEFGASRAIDPYWTGNCNFIK